LVEYKKTLNLPQTSFPMKAKLAEREPDTVKWWQEQGIFSRVVKKNLQSGKKPFVLHDGPPYANGHIHLGHVLNKVLKDVIIKFRNLNGEAADYIPGWDCHGLPIELQVVKSIGKRKKDLGLEEFRKECRAYAEKYVGIQNEEFQRLGNLGRWDTPYLTMDFEYQASIIREFKKIAEAGYIYKDKKPIYWCISCATALAEAEIEYSEHQSPSVYVNFPITESLENWVSDWQGKNPGFLIWTTTPWTLPANLAIAVHPEYEYVLLDSEKFGPLVLAEKLHEQVLNFLKGGSFQVKSKVLGRDLEGLTYRSILNDRKGKIILGNYVTLEQGTGLVHTAPGHGQDDYLSGLRYDLEIYSPVDDRGRFTEEVKHFSGERVFDANAKITQYLQEKGYLLAQEKIEHSYPHCWRCRKPVIFRATPQWFISMSHKDLRKQALTEIKNVKWLPSWGMERIYSMIENRPDWCLSRQRTWGIPIPALYCKECDTVILNPEIMEKLATRVEQEGATCWYTTEVKEFLPSGFVCPQCKGTEFRKETDILDVWFDSGISYSAVGKKFPVVSFPIDLYLEGSDQHRGWFHSSLLTAVMTRKHAPYKTVLTHGFVVDGTGRKMSKSEGNYISAQNSVKKYGAEILRLWVCAEDYRNDIRISEEIMQRLTEAYRKIRNTQKYLLGSLYDFDPDRHLVSFSKMTEIDRWIMDRFRRLYERVMEAYLKYEFHTVYHSLYNFCTVDLSSLYLDILKDRLYVEHPDDSKRRSSQSAIWNLAKNLSTLMAPILSVTAEEVWTHLPSYQGKEDSIFLENFSSLSEFVDEDLFQSFNNFLEVRGEISKALEIARKEKLIGQSLDAKVILQDNPEIRQAIGPRLQDLPFLWIVSQVQWTPEEPQGAIVYSSDKFGNLKIGISKADYDKCTRCWNYRKDIGENKKYPDACLRCSQVLEHLGV